MAKLRVLVPEATINYVKNPSFRFGIDGWQTKGATFLLLDRFTTTQAAPLTSPRSCEPGPGTLTIVDSVNKLSIASGVLSNSGATSDSTDPLVTTSDTPYMPGIAVYAKITRRNTAYSAAQFALQSDGDSIGRLAIFDELTIVDKAARLGSNLIIQPETTGNMLNLECEILICIDGLRLYTLIRESTLYPVWTLLWIGLVAPDYTGRNIRSRIFPGVPGSTYDADNLAIFKLYGNFEIGYGLATYYDATPASGATGTMTADGFVDFTWTPATAETLELDVRRTDNDNRWIVRCSQAGGTIKLIELNAKVETERASAVQTWTPGTAYTIKMRAVGDDIRTFVDSVAKNTYTSASFNNTATGIKVAGFSTGANLASFPRIPGATIQAEINEHLP